MNMKKSIICFMAFLCILFAGCKKDGGGTNTGEDLSYLIRTYYRYEDGGRIYKQTWTYDGHKETGYQEYINGQLYGERKNYSYNGLRASWDAYTYQIEAYNYNNEAYRTHVECEYLDNTFNINREKYRKTEYYYEDPQKNYITEAYSEYDGKKKVSYKSYKNGLLYIETCDYHYDDLRCSYKTMSYYSSGVVHQEQNYETLYLDETYLREKSRLRTRKTYDSDGNLIATDTYYSVHEYDGKKPIEYQYYRNGILVSLGRNYNYDGLTCFYFIDSYQNGELYSTSLYEVEYLE